MTDVSIQNRQKAFRKQMWLDQCRVVSERLPIIAEAAYKYGQDDLGDFYTWQNRRLLKSGAEPLTCLCIFESLLVEFKDTAELFQSLLQEDWRNIRTPTGAAVIGFPDFVKPFGLGNGNPDIPGYMPFEMFKLVNEEKKSASGLIAAGTLKPGTLIKKQQQGTAYRPVAQESTARAQKALKVA